MKRIIEKRISAAAAMLASMIIAVGCAEATFESKRLDRVITIDGTAPEWAGAEVHYDESDAYKLGFFNDDEYLYVYFATWSLSTQRQILMGGFTVWFDGGGRRQKALGINYPRKAERKAAAEFSAPPGGLPDDMSRNRREEPEGRTPGGFSPPDRAKLAAMLNQMQREAMLKSSAGDSLLLCATDEDSAHGGIRAMLNAKSRLLVIELRVPLDASGASPYAINAEPGDVIGVGFESGAMEKPQRTRPEGIPEDALPGGGMPSGGGMRPGGMGPGGMGGGEDSRTIKFWSKVKLAP